MDFPAISPELFLVEPASQWLGSHVLDLMEKAGLGVLFVNESGTLVYCNVSARKALGLQNRSLIGLQSKDLPIQEILGLDLEVLWKTQKTAIRTRVLIREDEEFEILIGPVRVGPLQERGLLMSLRPITSRIEQLAGLGEHLGATCHNLKNDLSSLKSWVSLLADHNAEWSAIDEGALKGLSSAIHAFENRIEEVLQPLQHQQYDVVDLITLVEQAWARACQTLGDLWIGQLRIEASATSLHVMAHRDRLDEVLQNLFKNAMEAIPNGWVHCTIEQSPEWITLQIADEGLGPEQCHFLRHESEKSLGHGLGLADAQRALMTMRGSLDLETLDEGRRALILRLPAA